MKIAILGFYNVIFILTMISIGFYRYLLISKYISVNMIKITIY